MVSRDRQFLTTGPADRDTKRGVFKDCNKKMPELMFYPPSSATPIGSLELGVDIPSYLGRGTVYENERRSVPKQSRLNSEMTE